MVKSYKNYLRMKTKRKFVNKDFHYWKDTFGIDEGNIYLSISISEGK